MLPPQLKNKIKECLIERNWRSLAEIFNQPNSETLISLCLQEHDLTSNGLSIKLILERINEGVQAWNNLVKIDDTPIEVRLEDILKAFKDFNYSIRKLPGENNNINNDDNQQKDWSRNEDDETRLNRLEIIKTYWDEKGNDLKLWVYQDIRYQFLVEDSIFIKTELSYYQKTVEFTAILDKYFDLNQAQILLKKLNEKLSLKEADDLLNKTKNRSAEFDVWKVRIKNAKIILTDLQECNQKNSWDGDCKLAQHFEKTKDLEFFKDYQGTKEEFELIKIRLNNVLKIKNLINSLTFDFDSLTNLSSKFPQNYQFPDRKKVDGLLKDHSRIFLLRAIINLELPDESEILKLVTEIKTSGIKLDDDIYARFQLAEVRTDILDILRAEISPRKSITEREEIYFKNLEPVEDKLKDWELPEFKTHWNLFQNAKLKRKLLEDLNQVLETSDLKKACKLFDAAEENLATNVFWSKNRNKFVAMKSEAEPFEKLLVDIKASTSTNQFHRNMDAFRDLLNFPLKYKGYKQELEKLIQDKLNAWTIKIDRFEKLPNSNICWFVGWNWLHIDLINRVYISLQKEKYPLNPSNSPLVKETQPYEYNMHQSGTLIISNITNFLDCILTVWPGAEFFSYQDDSDWIKLLGKPVYFKWDANQKKWNQCKRPLAL